MIYGRKHVFVETIFYSIFIINILAVVIIREELLHECENVNGIVYARPYFLGKFYCIVTFSSAMRHVDFHDK